MAEIWFIRHGESLANAGARTALSKTMRLTLTGMQQAQAVSDLFTEAPDLIIMSPYVRTQMTAAPTAHRFPETPKEVWPIQEISYLDVEKFANTTPDERRPAADAYWARRDVNYDDGDGAESFNQFVDRVRDTIDRLEKAPQKRIAVFGHGLFMHTVELLLQNPNMPTQDIMKKIGEIRVSDQHMPNCHVMKAQTKDGKMTLETGSSPNKPPIRNTRHKAPRMGQF